MQRYRDLRIFVNARHSHRLGFPVIIVILNDAQGIDPYVLDAKNFDQFEGFPEGDREAVPNQPTRMVFQILLRRAERLAVLPAVAQSSVRADFSLGLVEVGFSSIEEHHPVWKRGWLGNAATRMVF
jgi:hypothetical protein